MTSRSLSIEEQRRLVETWREAGAALERLRRAELASLTAEQSRQAAFDMLQLGGLLPADPERERSSGLVEMQRVLARARGCGPG